MRDVNTIGNLGEISEFTSEEIAELAKFGRAEVLHGGAVVNNSFYARRNECYVLAERRQHNDTIALCYGKGCEALYSPNTNNWVKPGESGYSEVLSAHKNERRTQIKFCPEHQDSIKDLTPLDEETRKELLKKLALELEK